MSSYTKETESELSNTFSYKTKTVTTRKPSNGSPHEVITLITEEVNGAPKPQSEQSSTPPPTKESTEHSEKTATLRSDKVITTSRNGYPSMQYIIFGSIFCLLIATGISIGVVVAVKYISNADTQQSTLIPLVPSSTDVSTQKSMHIVPLTTRTVRFNVLPKLAPKAEVFVHRLLHLTQISNLTTNVTIFSTEILESGEWNFNTAPKLNASMHLTVSLKSLADSVNLRETVSWLSPYIVSLNIHAEPFTDECDAISKNFEHKEIFLGRVNQLNILNLNKCFFDTWLRYVLRFPTLYACKVTKTDKKEKYNQSLYALLKRTSKSIKKFSVCDDCSVLAN